MRHRLTPSLRALRLTLGAVLAAGVLGAGAVSAQNAAPTAPTALAALKAPDGADLGTITLTQYPHGVLLRGELGGLKPGPHAIHIHANGTCAPDFAAAGGHFNPGNGKHGLVESPIHAGDLPNITADAGGKAAVEIITHLVNLGDGADSVFKQGGTSIIVHAGPDDYSSQPAGNSGDRVGCGVITKS